MIETENLTRKFGDIVAVEDLTLNVREGEVFGFLGPNGAGKTTTVRMLTCLIPKTSGEARIGDYSIDDNANLTKLRKMIGLLPENSGLYEELSAYKNLDYYGRLYECTEQVRKERIEYFLKMLDLWDKRNMVVGTFSKGMKQKLAIARSLIHDPQILFFDEPTANLDPEASRTVRDFVLELKKEGKTIFINTHNLDEAERICDRVGVMKTRLVALGATHELLGSLWGRKKTVIQLAQIDDAIVAAVKSLGQTNPVVNGNTLIVEVDDSTEENPRIVEAIISAGGHVQAVTEMLPTLEDVYLKLVQN